jgi:ribonuclease P protein component
VKIIKLKKNHEFARIYRKGRFLAAKHMVLYIMANRYGNTRVGFAAGLKCGGSVQRNRLKRLMRECYRFKEDKLKKGYDLVFSSRPAGEMPEYKEIDKEMSFLLTKLDLVDKERNT